jgi:hypothetical protein
LDHAQDAEDIGVEQRLRLADAGFLDGTHQIDAGVVDEDVDPAEAAPHIFNAGLNRSLISDVKRHKLDVGERRCRCEGTDAGEDPVAPSSQQLGGHPADTRRRTCD